VTRIVVTWARRVSTLVPSWVKGLCAATIAVVAVLSMVNCTFNPPGAAGRPLVVVETLEGDQFEPEPARRAGLVPSSLFWLVEGERVLVTWQEYLLVYPEDGAKFPQCRLCPHEVRRCEENNPDRWCFWCLSILRGGEWSVPGRPTVKVMEWQLPIRDTAAVLARLDHRAGCTTIHPDDPPAVTPARDAALQLLAWLETTSSEGQDPDLRGQAGRAELSVQIVHGRRVMDPRPLMSTPDGSLRWQVAGDADRWDENFSDRLRVVEARAVIFRLAPGRRLAPTQIPLRAVSVAGGPRCVAELDGHVSIARCHTSPLPGAPTTAIDATPTYLLGQPRDRLTWVVELEGAPVLEAGQALGIEFTLEARP
jgi:hypothetical protein